MGENNQLISPTGAPGLKLNTTDLVGEPPKLETNVKIGLEPGTMWSPVRGNHKLALRVAIPI